MPHCATLIQQLRQRGYRITPQREMIIEALAHSGDHITAEKVFEAVKQRSSAVNIATIYRTLDTLVAEGVICRTNLPTGQTVYVSQTHGEHLHLTCRICGEVLRVEQTVIMPLIQRLEEQYHFRADFQHLSITGVCKKCQAHPSQMGSNNSGG